MPISFVSVSENIKTVLEKLHKFHIHSLPVVNNASECVGWVDHTDLVRFMIATSRTEKSSSTTPPSKDLKGDDLGMLLERGNDFKMAKVLETTGIKDNTDKVAANQPLLPCTSGAPVSLLFQNFALGISRLPVVDSDNHKLITGIITQSQISALLQEHPDWLGEAGKQSVQSLGLIQGADKLVTVTESTPAIDAFEVMNKNELHNVGVVKDNGVLVGCLSATDVKLLSSFNFRILLQSVKDFVGKIRASEGDLKSYLVFAKSSATLEQVVSKFAEFGVHRVFITDDNQKPIGVVAMTDVCKIIAKQVEACK